MRTKCSHVYDNPCLKVVYLKMFSLRKPNELSERGFLLELIRALWRADFMNTEPTTKRDVFYVYAGDSMIWRADVRWQHMVYRLNVL